MLSKAKAIAKPLVEPVGIFLLTILAVSTVQWSCVQFMASYCAPWGMFGPLANLLSLGSPVCTFVNHLQVALADYYITIWAAAAGILITYVTTKKWAAVAPTTPSTKAE